LAAESGFAAGLARGFLAEASAGDSGAAFVAPAAAAGREALPAPAGFPPAAPFRVAAAGAAALAEAALFRAAAGAAALFAAALPRAVGALAGRGMSPPPVCLAEVLGPRESARS